MSWEFYTYDNEVWYRLKDGTTKHLTEQNREIVDAMFERIEQFYPEAFEALCHEYDRCKRNVSYFRFRVVNRFCKCNFGQIDDVPDVDDYGRFSFEYVPCPLRGECKCERVICRPKFNSKLSDAEMRVMRCVYKGQQRVHIADELCLSIHTVNNHIRNAFTRIGVHDVAGFTRWAAANHVFDDALR